jgi:3-keto-5-aminohexanoate cleavage enzyme
MSMFDEGRVIIRVAVNEMQPKALNPRIPYGPEEVAAEAIACAQAGASIVHFHSRTDEGAQASGDDRNGAGIYRRAMEIVARESDIIMEPTNLPVGADPTLAVDVPHVWSLVDDPPVGTRLEVVNIDGFRFGHNRTAWDERQQRLVPINNRVLDRDASFDGPEVIREVLKRDLIPFFGLFDLADARLLSAFARTGLVPQPVLVQLNFFCDLMRGPSPGVAALDAFLAEWRRIPVDSEVCLFVRGMPDRESYEELLVAALDRGVHLRVGLGDNPHLFNSGGNADMVEHAVEMASRKGLTPATAADLRARLQLSTFEGDLQ